METIVIAGAVRTPIGRYLGALREVPAYELGGLVLGEAAKRAGVDPAVKFILLLDRRAAG